MCSNSNWNKKNLHRKQPPLTPIIIMAYEYVFIFRTPVCTGELTNFIHKIYWPSLRFLNSLYLTPCKSGESETAHDRNACVYSFRDVIDIWVQQQENNCNFTLLVDGYKKYQWRDHTMCIYMWLLYRTTSRTGNYVKQTKIYWNLIFGVVSSVICGGYRHWIPADNNVSL